MDKYTRQEREEILISRITYHFFPIYVTLARNKFHPQITDRARSFPTYQKIITHNVSVPTPALPPPVSRRNRNWPEEVVEDARSLLHWVPTAAR
ncbi:hypothetical protein GWI33_019874 [Rhynchophorus ferrugineus]|uniref:Uncharacterized protein n=1 Tax=Rhynchophorus ferrugineus TaxID=354439 RepID=A0A834M0Z8_RHYFE|nr:hypothetical protein GWI33_019874 [Rhynchophorus ferrugineus]